MESDEDEAPVAVALQSDLLASAGGEGSKVEENSLPKPEKSHEPVPVTVITGYLGSGKTTLVKWVLSEQHGFRIAVILNEFGEETGIESAFVQDSEGQQSQAAEWVELANGCLCCSVKDNFVQALEALMQQRDRFDYVLVETTGLANPAPIAQSLWTDDELEAEVVLDAVVTVVDATQIQRQLAEKKPKGVINEAQLQVAYADIILLNKVDAAAPEQLQKAMESIQKLNPTVPLLQTQFSKVPLDSILNRRGYRLHGTDPAALLPLDVDPNQPSSTCDGAAACDHSHTCDHGQSCVDHGQTCTDPGQTHVDHDIPHRDTRNRGEVGSDLSALSHKEGHGSKHDVRGEAGPAVGSSSAPADDHHHDHKHDHKHDHTHDHKHETAITSVSFSVAEPLHMERLREWAEGLLWEREEGKTDILRMKGLIHVAGSPHKHMLQGVYDVYDIVAGPVWGPSETRESRVVVIGRHLSRAQLLQTLETCT